MSLLYKLKRKLKKLAFKTIPGKRVLEHGPRAGRKVVALTFDDGPCVDTMAYLELLEQLDVPATFFLQGNRAAEHPELIGEYTRRGHQVASHGYDHRPFPDLSTVELGNQLSRTEAVIGRQPLPQQWVRPPYGKIDARSLAHVVASGRVVAMWSFDSEDYSRKDPADLVARCSPQAIQPGDVILFHEEQSWTKEALPQIVGALRAAGFAFVTMAEMFV
jgi:peptidoglycan/xylan/chitin deacetylase (PgdA/CDA1 family)